MLKFLLIFIILLCSCSNLYPQEPADEGASSGEPYFTLVCSRYQDSPPPNAIFRCSELLDTDLLSGDVTLSLFRNEGGEGRLVFCGEDIILNSGNLIYDSLLYSLTEGSYGCHGVYERGLGNEFDWSWVETTSTLEMIWRPNESTEKILSIYLEEGDPERTVSVFGRAYFHIEYNYP